MTTLDVRASKSPTILIGVLGVLLLPLGLANLIGGVREGFEGVPLGIGGLTLGMFGVVIWLFVKGHRNSVRVFHADGLERNDGRQLSWTDLDRVVDRVRIRPSGKRFLWRTEIQFTSGESAWVIPSKVGNYAEVAGFVRSLPCEHVEQRA